MVAKCINRFGLFLTFSKNRMHFFYIRQAQRAIALYTFKKTFDNRLLIFDKGLNISRGLICCTVRYIYCINTKFNHCIRYTLIKFV